MQPPLGGGRLDRQWRAVEKLTSRSRRSPWAAFGLAAVAVSAVLLLLLVRPDAAPVARDGAVVETSCSNTQVLSLADGSTMKLSQSSRLQVTSVRADEIHLVLTRGALSLDVTHVPKRAFIVSAGGFDVIVRGTRFRVELSEGSSPRLTVTVEAGRIETRRSGSAEPPGSVIAGESWSARVAPAAPPQSAATPPAPPRPDAPAIQAAPADPEPSDKASAAGPTSSVTEPEDEFSKFLKAGKYREAYQALGPDGFAREMERASARRLLELADAARLGGHPRDAAVALDKLRRAYRRDPRAGLAALELGRLRNDAFGDPAGALEAFQDASALAASGSVREDAEARIVQVLEKLGDKSRCVRARDAYLGRFPNGIHAATMRARCSAM
jgi:hypothetical protein